MSPAPDAGGGVSLSDISPRIAGQDKAAATRVYRAILQSIREGALREGDKLPDERTMSVRFEASRGTVRHALAMMEHQGLVVRKVGSGTYLKESAEQVLSATDLPVAAHHENVPTYAEILEGRLLFEPAMMELSARRADEEDFARMRQQLAVVREAERWLAFKEGIYGVHLAIFRATHNRFLVQVFETVINDRRAVDYDGRTGVHGPVSPLVREQAVRELSEIVEALVRRDGKAASRLAEEYFTRILGSLSLYG
ncbi:FadR/GntR family transcriptional regulator [Paracidovorax cattleyae]|uniref:DNA-binding transcriptional regulator, FadR family n=1 Tax=Paracidovorax cattleyae TaxID=80868 RepID=A0A1H0RCU2_9BURK|nr:GntR family transcriptional regulator [Paracidovorax cattleyae]SDP27442.1 DNA-binding transcriptional regulator, FadR family [Paracidovorax cattleyae]